MTLKEGKSKTLFRSLSFGALALDGKYQEFVAYQHS